MTFRGEACIVKAAEPPLLNPALLRMHSCVLTSRGITIHDLHAGSNSSAVCKNQ